MLTSLGMLGNASLAVALSIGSSGSRVGMEGGRSVRRRFFNASGKSYTWRFAVQLVQRLSKSSTFDVILLMSSSFQDRYTSMDSKLDTNPPIDSLAEPVKTTWLSDSSEKMPI